MATRQGTMAMPRPPPKAQKNRQPHFLPAMTTSPNPTDSTAMAAAPPPLTVADFVDARVHDLLARTPHAPCNALSATFRRAKDDATGQPAHALALLADICSMSLVPEQPTVVYRPRFISADGGTSMGPAHVPADAIGALAQLAADVANAPLRARIADLVWMLDRSRGTGFARMAIAAYRTLPTAFGTWRGETQAGWHRALQLAKQVRDGESITAIETALLDAFFNAAADHESGYEPLYFLVPLRAERRAAGRVLAVAQQLDTIGRSAMARSHTFVAQAYFEAAAEWYEWAGDAAQRAHALSLAAGSLALQAAQPGSAIVQHHWLSKAIGAYRRVPGPHRERLGVEDALEALRRARDSASQATLGEMGTLRGPREDVTDRMRAAVAHVTGRPQFEALLAFCGLDNPPDVDALHAAAAASLTASPLSTLLGVSVMAGDGRVVDNTGPEADWQAQVDARARALFTNHAGRKALAALLPARDQLRFEHDYRLADFVAIAERSAVVPADRARIVGQGLHAGFCGDMVQAIHILMPQFEHAIRHVLRGAGAFTAQYDKEGRDMEVALGSLVGRPEMVQEFGGGLTLAVHALMCDPAGPNLRNDVAHGLADEAVCESAHALYAWWLILQLVTETCVAAMEAAAREGHGAASENDEASGEDAGEH
jgi:hypothetical protein